MKVKTLSALAGLGGTLIMSCTASANYTGLSVIKYTTLTVGGGSKDVYRVYANFTNADDYLTSVAGSPSLGGLTIKSLNAAGTASGSNFYNPGGAGGNLAPVDPNGTNEWGTFVDIGLTLGNQAPTVSGSPVDQTGLSPGFPNFINGNVVTSTNAGWFTAGPVEQGRASYAGDGDLALRVFCMQLTVNAGENVAGTVAIGGVNAGALAAAFQTNADQTFSSAPIPAPGALALLGLAGLVGSRRRRG